ncbi:hypothetical protein GXW82_32435 [Streptacidiphilus sp. 4-A2]|nr:hypothetical protein [Streptacidiphilus sp. 4-A2]
MTDDRTQALWSRWTGPRHRPRQRRPRSSRPSPRRDAPIKGRKNGLYPALSDELTEVMKSGWADTELHGLVPTSSPYAAKRRAALSARFPGAGW